MQEQYITLTKSEALALFCFQEINPVSVLRDKQSILTMANHDALITDLRRMVLLVKTFTNYNSDEVRYIIQHLNARFINDIYKDENSEFCFRDFKFMITFVLRYRNLTDYRLIKTIKFENVFIEYVNKKLLSLNAITAYQRSVF